MTALDGHVGSVSAADALTRLMEGNARFLRGELRHSRVPKEVLADLVKGQRPYATILGCSDSRVPTELIFDAGFGDLFIIRVAGNVVSPGSWAASSTLPCTSKRSCSWCSDTKAAAPYRRLWRRNFRAHGSVRASSYCSITSFRVLTKSPHCFRHSNNLIRPWRPTSVGPCANSLRRPRAAREWPRAA